MKPSLIIVLALLFNLVLVDVWVTSLPILVYIFVSESLLAIPYAIGFALLFYTLAVENRTKRFSLFIVAFVILSVLPVAAGDQRNRLPQTVGMALPFYLLGLGMVVSEALRGRKVKKNPNAELLDPVLSVGMTGRMAVTVISENFPVNRLPRYYSDSPEHERIEMDTDKATFVITTNNGKVASWSAK